MVRLGWTSTRNVPAHCDGAQIFWDTGRSQLPSVTRRSRDLLTPWLVQRQCYPSLQLKSKRSLLSLAEFPKRPGSKSFTWLLGVPIIVSSILFQWGRTAWNLSMYDSQGDDWANGSHCPKRWSSIRWVSAPFRPALFGDSRKGGWEPRRRWPGRGEAFICRTAFPQCYCPRGSTSGGVESYRLVWYLYVVYNPDRFGQCIPWSLLLDVIRGSLKKKKADLPNTIASMWLFFLLPVCLRVSPVTSIIR